jgi:hypothetical protein
VQVLFWLILAAGAVTALLGLAALGTPGPGQGDGFFLIPVGVIMAILGWLGGRVRMRCDRDGVRLRMIRTTFVPAREVGSVRVRPVSGSPGLARAMIAVNRRDGSELRLEPTLTVRMSQASVDARLQMLTARITAVLGLESPTRPN